MVIGVPAFVVSLMVAAQLATQPAERPRSKAWADPEGDLADRLQKRAVECVSKAAAARQAATVVIHLRGMDSWVAYGLVSTASGDLRWFNYDSDIIGGGDVAWLTEGLCKRPRLRKRRGVGQTFSCPK